MTYRLVAEINTATNKLISLNVYVLGAETASLSLSNVDLVYPNYTTIEFGLVNTGHQTNNPVEGLKSIKITETPPAETYADYTIHFVDNNGKTVKDDEIRNGVVGQTAVANSVDKTTIYDGENRYVYSTDGGGVEVKNDGSAEFTITYIKSTKEAYSVMAQVGGVDLDEIASGTTFFDEGSTAYWSKYINKSGSWYETTTYGKAITSATTNIAFTATSLDYFFEFEDMDISKAYNSLEDDTRASNGKAKTLNNKEAYATTTSTVAAGIYIISLNGIKWGNYADNYRITYSTDGTNWFTLGDISYSTSEEGVKTLENALIPSASYVRITTTGGDQTPRRYLDYMILKKTADLPATENIVVSTAGFATYVSNYNLDFSSATTKAYKVNVASKGVATLTEVSKVPAKTPILLYAAGGNGEGEAIPVTTEAVSAVSGNNLVAGTGAAVATTSGDYTNMILNDGEDGIGFYYAAGQTVAANRAYLHIATSLAPDVEATSRMTMVFADEATGIGATLMNNETVNNEIYNLQGQRVANPSKGLYIMNGKKVILK